MILSAPDNFSAAVAAPERNDDRKLWFIFQGAQMLVTRDANGAQVPQLVQAQELALEPLRELYLGTLNDQHCFACEVADKVEAPASAAWSGLRALFGQIDDSHFALAGRAFQIMDWDRSHQFCGRCAAPTELKTTERARVCPSCSQLHYPRIAPAVMALVRRGNEILLARSPHFAPGMYSALAGFVEPGETLEQCLAREVREEVGVEVKNVRYFASQPWPFPHSLMIAFNADWASGEIRIDPAEIEDAQWFSLDRLPAVLPGKISISRRLLDATLLELKGHA
jgi:NAD+ diphosphatase